MSDLVSVEPKQIAPRQHFFMMEPEQQVAHAARIAKVLADVIAKQNLYSNIQGKKYIKAEGWQTLGTFLGVLPKEREVKRLPDGSFEAYVDIVKFGDGTVVSGASAICSVNEKRWGNADEYARRSMAITRATGKAYRTGFAWIATLAGYEPTPAEEMPRHEEEAKPEAPKVVAQPYDGKNPDLVDRLQIALAAQKIEKMYWTEISNRMEGKYSKDLPGIIRAVKEEFPSEQA
jgi:hypothetical protein